jgi:mono/diheme cytochrome c family protein
MRKLLLATGCMGLLLAAGLPLAAAGDAKKGEAAFNDNCAVCHNSDSTEAKIGPGLKGVSKHDKLVNGKAVSPENIKQLITDGTASMPGFGDSISSDTKDDIVAYLMTL